ncbi:MAG: HI0074 family nucleotidyltransferase substrate-binding subunit [Cyanobacteria bacterium REEB446]|nr:HI0074 family nucleotidyltransferase substrate-binding subunit [Cyanobacteria bacterium REEB446]
MKLDLSSLKKAINALNHALNEYEKNPSEFVKDSCIQRFEFTYELSHKFIKRYLEITEANRDEIDEMSFQQLIRRATERGLLLSDWESWRKYKDSRNKTSHTYDEEIADEVFEAIPDFLKEAEYLYERLEERDASN